MSAPVVVDPEQRKERSGCLLALYVALACAAVVILVVGLGLFVFVRSERGQQLIGAVRDGATLLQQAMNAPGTEELRAAGCGQAMVFARSEAAKVLGQLSEEFSAEILKSLSDDTVIMCTVLRDGTPPECSELAKVYSSAVPGATEHFGVTVQQQGRGKPLCQGSYSRDGSRVGDIERK
jgi:hypothetical protein